jgi:hypothetical protein
MPKQQTLPYANGRSTRFLREKLGEAMAARDSLRKEIRLHREFFEAVKGLNIYEAQQKPQSLSRVKQLARRIEREAKR